MSNLTPQDIKDKAALNLPDNFTKEISAEDVRSLVIDLADSSLNRNTDGDTLGLKTHSEGVNYLIGETSVFEGFIYQAIANTTGAFDLAKWDILALPIETSDVTGLDAEQATQDGRITAVESDVTSQDGRITAVESDITTQDGRITAVELNQNDGVERWGTLALLTSNGSDSTTISYKVDSDPTSTNNGFYEYTGAAYVLVAPLLNGDVVEGESEGVTGGKVYESIKDFAPKTVGVNNFTQEGAVENFYVKYGNGVLTANAGYWASAKITLLPNTTYTYSVEQTDNNIEQFAMYDVNDVYIEGYAASGLKTITFTTAANCDNIRFSINKASLDSSYMLETGDVRSQRYQPYNVGIPQSEMELQGVSSEYLADDVFNALGIIKEVITVDINGGKDFTNIRDAVDSITDTTKNYLIKIEEGVYELLDEYSIGEIEDVAFKGQDIPENVWLEGVGNRDDVHLRGYLDSGVYSAAAMIRVSGLNFVGTGGIKNIYVSGLNVRYPIHDDVNIENVFREYDNVKAYQFEGLGLGQAVGGGTRSGGLYNIKGLKCHTEQRSVNPATNIFPFSFHNNASFVRESKLTIENSEFTSYTGGVSMAYGSIGSGQNDIISLIGNKLQGKIVLFEETVGSGVGIDFELTGHGNTSVPVEIVETNASNYKYILNEEVSIKKNRAATAIVKGDLVKLSSTGQGVEKLGVSDGAVLFYGISFEDLAENDQGAIKTGGYLAISDTGLTPSIGDKIGIVSGTLAVVASGDYVGVVVNDDYIKL